MRNDIKYRHNIDGKNESTLNKKIQCRNRDGVTTFHKTIIREWSNIIAHIYTKRTKGLNFWDYVGILRFDILALEVIIGSTNMTITFNKVIKKATYLWTQMSF